MYNTLRMYWKVSQAFLRGDSKSAANASGGREDSKVAANASGGSDGPSGSGMPRQQFPPQQFPPIAARAPPGSFYSCLCFENVLRDQVDVVCM